MLFRFHNHVFVLGGFGSNGSSTQGFQSDGDSTNTTVTLYPLFSGEFNLITSFLNDPLPDVQVFVGGLDPNVSEDELKQSFSQYGEIASVKIPVGKQCGFVQFVQRYAQLHVLFTVSNISQFSYISATSYLVLRYPV